MLLRSLLALALLGQAEVEPNGSFARATETGTLPSPHPVYCSGSLPLGDRDFWKIHLDYQTPYYVEGKARFQVACTGPVSLAVFDHPIGQGYRLVGRWESADGSIDTGDVPLEYYYLTSNTAMAVVTGAGDYNLCYW